MKIKDKILKISIIVCLLLVEITSVFLMYKSSTVNTTKLDDVRLREVSQINTFAIMLEQSDGTYKESDSTSWPTNMAYNSDKSGCIDNSGNKIDNALSFDSTNNLATVSTQGTSYCYLYFDLDKTGPIITDVVDAGDGKITFTVEDELNEVSEYCVNQNETDTSDCTWYDAIEGTQTTESIVTENGDYYVHVSDTLGNIGHSSAVTIEVSKLVGETILGNPTTGLDTTTTYGDLNRYQGTNVNNYICFGTSDKDTCTGTTDQYMYRIIGINSSGQLKLIKKEALNTAYAWNSSAGVTWNSASLYTNLNGSYFYTNTTYVPTAWKSKIALTTWKYGDTSSDASYNGVTAYTTESAWTSTVSNYIGLMYQSDYLLAYNGGNPGSYSNAATSWIHLSNCDSGAPSTTEWLMSRISGFAWIVDASGRLADGSMPYAVSVRPVFYLTSDVQFVGGTGTSADPFIIE